ncbi:unnamed protein product [Auanema sp. JU1783]|nr:unnamed protein product [Auanema sp. JU1783]
MDTLSLYSFDPASMSQKRMPSLRILYAALVVSLGGSFHFGYQLAITNPAQKAFLTFLNDTWGHHMHLSSNGLSNIWSFTVAVMFLGALAGSFSISFVADYVGRKRGLFISIGLGIISAALSCLAFFVKSFVVYIISRITMGYSISLSLSLAAVFLSEASPCECRGLVGMITGCTVQLGTVVGSIIAMPQIFGTSSLWYLIYVIELIIMIVFYCFLPFLPESAGHLTKIGAYVAAKNSIKYYHNCDDDQAEIFLAEVKEEQKESSKNYKIVNVLKNKSLRGRVLTGAVVAFGMSFSGIAVINAYAVQILSDTGLTTTAASLANAGISFVSLVASSISSLGVDRFVFLYYRLPETKNRTPDEVVQAIEKLPKFCTRRSIDEDETTKNETDNTNV